MKKAIAGAIATTLVACSLPGHAEILSTGSRASNYTNSTVNTYVTVPINNTFSSIQFTTTAPGQIVRITYNAECGAIGPAGTWLAVVINVDGIAAAPASGNSFALCTATSTTNYNWVGATRQATIKVPFAGTHTVNVQGYGVGTTTWWLGDSSIVVDR